MKIHLYPFSTYLFWSITILSLLLILHYRFSESITRNYGNDEYANLHGVYNISQGLMPFRDFFFYYSPLFSLTLLPLFKVIGNSFLIFTASRVVMFGYFLTSLIFTYAITRLLTNKRIAIIAIIVSASLPISIEKVIDIRQDNLMVPLCLGGIFFFLKALKSKPRRNFLLSSVFFGLSFVVLIKIALTILGFLLSITLLSLFDKKIRLPLLKYGHVFILSGFLVVISATLLLAYLGILPIAFQSMFIYAKEFNESLRFGYELKPLYFFYPNDIVYGTFKGIPWYTNTLLIVLAILGILTVFISAIYHRSVNLKLTLFLPMMFSFLSLYFVHRPFQQYLLPTLAFIPFFVAFFMDDVKNFLSKKKSAINIVPTLLLCGLLVISTWRSWQVKKNWRDDQDKAFVNYMLANTNPDDVFWPFFIFGKDGYVDYIAKTGEYPESLKRILPSYPQTLEKRKTKYIIYSTQAVKNGTWPFDQPDTQDLRQWILTNFHETNYPDLWIRNEAKS